jgi:hypothetical protein
MAASRHRRQHREGVTEMPDYNVKVAVRSGEVYLRVDHGLTGAGYPHLFLRSSSSAAPVLADPGRWPTGLAWSITDRLRNGGDEKGRVLAVWQEMPGHPPIPLSVLAWHAHGTGPLYVFDAGHSSALNPKVGLELVALLLDALLEAAKHPGHQLHWTGSIDFDGHRPRSSTRPIASVPTIAERTYNAL